MKNKPYKKFDKVEHQEPKKKVRLEVYDDGLYVGTINTDFYWDEKKPIDKETLLEYVHKRMPTRKIKHLTVKVI